MVPATIGTRSVNPAKAGGASAGNATGPGHAPDSFENTLKQAGKQRDQAKAEAPVAAQPDPVDQSVDEAVEEPAVGKTEEGQEPKKAKPAKETKGKRAIAEAEDLEGMDAAAAEAVFNLTQALVEDEPLAPELEMEAAVEDEAPREMPEPMLKDECGEVMELGDTAAAVASAEWSLPGTERPAVVEDAAPLVMENIAVQGFQADAQTGFELDPAVMRPVEGEEAQAIDLGDVRVLEAAAEQGDAGANEGFEHPEGAQVVRRGIRTDETVESFGNWVEQTLAATGHRGVEAVDGLDGASNEMAPPEVVRVDDAPSRVSTLVAAAKPPAPAEARFAQENHPRIVTAVRSELAAGGGKMEIRLDPPELGALQVKIEMRDGVMTAAFQTSNDEATRLLSHSLSHLKNTLESQGIHVEKLQVQQAPREEPSSRSGEDGGKQQQGGHDERESKQEQQRREMLQRMWRRISVGSDPVDLTA